MPITAYSKEFKIELTTDTYIELFKAKYGKEPDASHVKKDIECPCCQSTNAHIVPPSKHKQGYFAFTKNLEKEYPHLPICCFHDVVDKNIQDTDYFYILGQNRSSTTKLIHLYVSTAIDNNLITFEDIRNFRQNFIKLRTSPDYYVVNKPILAKILLAYHTIVGTTKFSKTHEYHVLRYMTTNKIIHDWVRSINNQLDFGLNLKTFITNNEINLALDIMKSRENELMFFRLPKLYSHFKDICLLSSKIVENHVNGGYSIVDLNADSRADNALANLNLIKPNIKNDYSKSLFNAYSLLLLYVSRMKVEQAYSLHQAICSKINLNNTKHYANVISLNPLKQFHAWALVEVISKTPLDLTDEELNNLYKESELKLEELLHSSQKKHRRY